MEEKHDIVAPAFKAKGKPVSKAKISPRPVVKVKAGNIQLTIFKGHQSQPCGRDCKGCGALCSLTGTIQTMFI